MVEAFAGDVLRDRLKQAAAREASIAIGAAMGRWSLSEPESSYDENPSLDDLFQAVSLRSAAGTTTVTDRGAGVLVDDPGIRQDVVAGIRAALTRRWGASGERVYEEVAEALSPDGGLRKFICSHYFGLHVKDYSKSRRKAPIYWQLGTPSASYSIWVYIYRMSPDTLHVVLRDYVEPKLRFETERLAALRTEVGTSPTPSQRKDIEARESFVDELRVFRDEIHRVAPLWSPDFEDGVVINASFLHRLFTHTRSWQKECEKHWKKLKAGDYDWAQLAMRLWPERVVPKCTDDRSLAIAHGLEDVFWDEDEDGKWRPREVDGATVAQHVQQRTIPAIKEALRQVAAAPPPQRSARRSARRAPRRTRATPAPTPPNSQLSLDLPSLPPDRTAASQDALRAALGRFPEGARKVDLVTASEIDAKDWKKAIDALVAAGEMMRTGHGRGTRYTLAGSG